MFFDKTPGDILEIWPHRGPPRSGPNLGELERAWIFPCPINAETEETYAWWIQTKFQYGAGSIISPVPGWDLVVVKDLRLWEVSAIPEQHRRPAQGFWHRARPGETVAGEGAGPRKLPGTFRYNPRAGGNHEVRLVLAPSRLRVRNKN